MKLSMLFLLNRLGRGTAVAELNRCENPFFSSLRFFVPGVRPEEGTLYMCAGDVRADDLACLRGVKNCGVIWTGPARDAPWDLPVLRFSDGRSLSEIWNTLSALFDFYNRWSERVSSALIKGCPLDDVFQLLCEVTPNAWYLADTSFRVLTAKKDPDLEDMSAIWRFLYKEKHLPLDVVMTLSEEGVLSQMNQQKSAYIPVVEPFNMPFVSKTIFSGRGILGHFYLIGVYNRLSSYELEIAEHFGNLISASFAGNPDLIPTQGRIYDNFFIDLIEGTDAPSPERLEELLSLVGWKSADPFVVAVVRKKKTEVPESTVSILQIHVLEKTFNCRCFLYKGTIVGLFNLHSRRSDSEVRSLEANGFLKKLRSIQADYGDGLGLSEIFSGRYELLRLNEYYRQAAAALPCAAVSDSGISRFRDIAVDYFADSISRQMGYHFAVHPAVFSLRKYDNEHRANLEKTLRVFLDCHLNIADASRQLFIHRNTLINRIQLIESITQLDLKDPDTRVWLMLSFRMREPAPASPEYEKGCHT